MTLYPGIVIFQDGCLWADVGSGERSTMSLNQEAVPTGLAWNLVKFVNCRQYCRSKNPLRACTVNFLSFAFNSSLW